MTEKQTMTIKHTWAGGGVSSYPLSHPIVGQGEFFQTFKNFIHVVDQESERFAHVFAIIGQWGVGKSRLAYELISQINDSSCGWYIRDQERNINPGRLFDSDRDREKYLGLYIRYSQVATEHHNIENWFAYGLYKALLPLAKSTFDNSIQGQIAKEAFDRLLVKGFDSDELAKRLELHNNYSDEQLYEDPYLLSKLCSKAYRYFQDFEIEYILVAMDELETIAETSTYGLDPSDIKQEEGNVAKLLDGRAIKLLGKAIKEEDPRRKLPWLRYVALCSPAVGDELRDIQSTARRFELVELSQNPFADVSDFVDILRKDSRLDQDYPTGLVEAAYTMSGGNFGWFNVIMAYVDEVLEQRKTKGHPIATNTGELFEEVVRSSSRVRDYVLDHNAIQELSIENRSKNVPIARDLLYGQLPVSLSTFDAKERQVLLNAQNEYDEPIAILFCKADWSDYDCSQTLRKAKFSRDGADWYAPGVQEPFSLAQLLDNLSTYSIHETKGNPIKDGKRTLLIPLIQEEFVELVRLLYPHGASEDVARVLWTELVGPDDIDASSATHIGPSVAMLSRLDLRYRKQSQQAPMFRTPEENDAYEAAQKRWEAGKPDIHERDKVLLTGLMRLIDQNWKYQQDSSKLPDKLCAITTRKGGHNEPSGLLTCNALKLHPQGKLILAYVRNKNEVSALCDFVANHSFREEGRFPVLVATTSRAVVDFFIATKKTAQEYMTVYQLSPSEDLILRRIGIPIAPSATVDLNPSRFNGAFDSRLRSIQRQLMQHINDWRQTASQSGSIAWPIIPGRQLKSEEQDLLFKGWVHLLTETVPPHSLDKMDENAPVDVAQLRECLPKMSVRPEAIASGYSENERAMLFSSLNTYPNAVVPRFLTRIVRERLLKNRLTCTMEYAEEYWLWGFLWEGGRSRYIFENWMTLLEHLGFVQNVSQGRHLEYSLLSLASLRSHIIQAENWLNGEYNQIVHNKMSLVFGQGRVLDLFGPNGAKTREAKERINNARAAETKLSSIEDRLLRVVNDDEADQLFADAARHRRVILNEIQQVYVDEEYNNPTVDENIKTLNFDDHKSPLWKKIKIANHFADKVLRIQSLVSARIDKVADLMRIETEGIQYFPVSLFTLSLEKVRNIIDGAVGQAKLDSSTAQQQETEPGTLGYLLKNLKVSEAWD